MHAACIVFVVFIFVMLFVCLSLYVYFHCVSASVEEMARLAELRKAKQRMMSRQASKLHSLLGNTHEQRLAMSIDKLLLDAKKEEGRARARFIKNFSVLEKEPHTMCGVIRQFMDSLKTYIESKRKADIMKFNNFEFFNVDMSDHESVEDEIGLRINYCVENAVIMPVYHRIVTHMKKSTASTDELIIRQMIALRGKPQSFFGIKQEDVSATNWSTAIYEMDYMDKKTLPADKLKSLLNAAKAIYKTFNDDKHLLAIQKGIKYTSLLWLLLTRRSHYRDQCYYCCYSPSAAVCFIFMLLLLLLLLWLLLLLLLFS